MHIDILFIYNIIAIIQNVNFILKKNQNITFEKKSKFKTDNPSLSNQKFRFEFVFL